jgi:hypothetical protein
MFHVVKDRDTSYNYMMFYRDIVYGVIINY